MSRTLKIRLLVPLFAVVCALAAAPRVLAHADMAGEWAVEFDGGALKSPEDMKMIVVQDDSRLSGRMDWSAGEFPIKGTINDDKFTITWTTRVNGVMTEITFTGTVKGEEINGNVQIAKSAPFDLYARRTAHN